MVRLNLQTPTQHFLPDPVVEKHATIASTPPLSAQDWTRDPEPVLARSALAAEIPDIAYIRTSQRLQINEIPLALAELVLLVPRHRSKWPSGGSPAQCDTGHGGGPALLRSALSVADEAPQPVTTDGYDSDPRAIREVPGTDVEHRDKEYLDRRIEQDHRGLS